jgi:hypothetical protein
LLEHRQRHRTDGQDGIVEAPLIELRAKLFFGLAAMTANLDLAKLVGQRLSGPGDVAIDLGGDLMLGERRAVAQVLIAWSRVQPNWRGVKPVQKNVSLLNGAS